MKRNGTKREKELGKSNLSDWAPATRWNESGVFHRFVWALGIGERVGNTYVSITIERVVGQFYFIEDDWLRLPVRSKRGTIGMNVHSLGTLWLRTASRYPLGAREFVATIADRCHFKHNTIVRILLQSGQCDAKRWKHPSKKMKE